MTKTTDSALVPVERIAHSILILRGQRVIIDRDLAAIYGVSTGRLNEAVKRNAERFPEDFMFRLTRAEAERSRSQIAILKPGRGKHRKYLPYVFTEQGVAMLSGILNSDRAIHVNIEIMRAFVRIRKLLASNKELSKRLDELEMKYDGQFKVVFDAIRQLMTPPPPKQRKIGFSKD